LAIVSRQCKFVLFAHDDRARLNSAQENDGVPWKAYRRREKHFMANGDNLSFLERPKLKKPYMVCGIGGWVDGGAAATGTVRYLVRRLKAKHFAEIPIARFHIFQIPGQESLRPKVRMKDGLLEDHRFPSNRFSYWVHPNADHDLIFFRGTEPNLNWEEYAEAIFSLASEMSVSRIYLLGGVMDACPHTREPWVSFACTSAELKEEMAQRAMGDSNYEGPGSIETTVMHYCQARGLDTASLVAGSTFYPDFDVAIGYNPKVIRALMKRLNPLLGLKLDLADLDTMVEDFEGKMDLLVGRSDKFKAHVAQLEEKYEEVVYEEPLDLSGEEAVEMVQEFLQDDKTSR
jgi:proteasome assembly chaperone (PAC2) family protein